MAAVVITIKDDGQGVALDIGANPLFPESALMYTNAQMMARDIIAMIEQYAKQINSALQQRTLIDAAKLGTS